jgi:RNase H-fold protein (predicted Holliday junction resolvase)
MRRVLAIDPGEVHCGIAIFEPAKMVLTKSAYTCVRTLEVSPADLFRLVEFEPLDVVVIEEFRLYPDKAGVQGYSQLKTVEVIGVVRYLCEREKVELVQQGASIKRVARAQMAARGVPNLATALGKGGHAADAVLHGWWYTNKPDKKSR